MPKNLNDALATLGPKKIVLGNKAFDERERIYILENARPRHYVGTSNRPAKQR